MKITIELNSWEELKQLQDMDFYMAVEEKKKSQNLTLAMLLQWCSPRTNNSVASAGVETVEQLCSLTEADLLRVPNLGHKSLNEIKLAMKQNGLSLRSYSGGV